MADLKTLSRLLNNAGLMAKKQDNQILLYNRGHQYLSRGVLVSDLDSAQRMVLEYTRFLQGSGFKPITDFAADHQYRSISYKEVDNRVDEQSAYYINKAAMSSVSRINLLLVAKALKSRVEASVASRVVDGKVTPSDVRRHKKRRAAAALERPLSPLTPIEKQAVHSSTISE